MVDHRSDQGDRFHILFVCTGNVCRSPFAEILTRHLLVGRLGGQGVRACTVASAGVEALDGSGMHPDSRAQLLPWGLEGVADRFVARHLSSTVVHDASLILGAAPRHRSAVVGQDAATLPIAFSVREFARLAAVVNTADLPDNLPERGRALVEIARRQRGLVPAPPDDDDVPDPMGRPAEAHRVAAALIRDAVQRIVDVLAPRTPGVRPLPPV